MTHQSHKLSAVLAGGGAGLINGFFGGGGGMVLVPLLMSACHLDRKNAMANSVAIILPLCALSAGIYCVSGVLDPLSALPYLIGGLLGGWIGGRLFQNVPALWLKRGFALLILYGAGTALLR